MDIAWEIKQNVIQQIGKRHERFLEIERRIADPEVIANQPLYRELLRERGGMARMAETYARYAAAKTRLDEARAILDDPSADNEFKELAQDESAAAEKEIGGLTDDLLSIFVTADSTNNRDVIMEIRAGTGGEEAALFAAELFRMYSRYAERRGWKVEIMDSSPSDMGGLREIVFSVQGGGVYEKLRFESGGHRVQRVPETESQGRIHTSLATVAVMPEAEEVDVELKPEDLDMQFIRSQGPGGQKVNKTSSCVRLIHKPTGITVRCQDEKSQHRNRDKALKLLRSRLYEMEQEKLQKERSELRRTQVGSGDRNERIRTYNFPQDRLTDHRIGFNMHGLERILLGEIDELFDSLAHHDLELRLKALAAQ
ncbi:MAG TPA: peptide chain release factor 1 [Candidatus Brocadiia bacterium]|nr:peptide chain release factor 1 [Candidatus Brocadiia bacterium]